LFSSDIDYTPAAAAILDAAMPADGFAIRESFGR
jgi:hypothetical protein